MKKKILMICDHPLATSGVGVQARYLIDGLVATGKYSFRVFGAAIKHSDYSLVKVNNDFMIKPIDGFGDHNLVRLAIASERPDAILLFTDPRFFNHIFSMEDEIHQVCPIAYWHVWDNDPYPAFNQWIYESVDLFNCHSHKTYSMVHEHFPEKTNYVPHAIPKELFFKIENKAEVAKAKEQLLGKERKDHFVCVWVNRNARRKKPNDVLLSWKLFVDYLEKEHGHRNATLLMHTDPLDPEGPNLLATTKHLQIEGNVVFSTDKLEFQQMNMLYNIADIGINIACAEGFGLSTLESMQVGNPIIACKTGGLARQITNHATGEENGVALDPAARVLVGSQAVPYIYEDHVNNNEVVEALIKLYDMGSEQRELVGNRAIEYVKSEFDLSNTVAKWDATLTNMMDNFTPGQWRVKTL